MPASYSICSYRPVKICDEKGVNERFALAYAAICTLQTAPTPQDIYTICNVGSRFVPGQTTLIITEFIGYKIRFIRGGIPQFKGNPGTGNIYFNYEPLNGNLTVSVAIQANEELILQAYK
jgi:hypothetical protein